MNWPSFTSGFSFGFAAAMLFALPYAIHCLTKERREANALLRDVLDCGPFDDDDDEDDDGTDPLDDDAELACGQRWRLN